MRSLGSTNTAKLAECTTCAALIVLRLTESTVLRVLAAEGIALPGNPRRDPVPRTPWPDWLEWKPNRIWAYDFTHFARARRAAIAILDMVSRKWLTTLLAAEESSTQVEVAFTAALDADGMTEAAKSWASPELQAALNSRNEDRLAELVTAGQVPLLLAVSDNGPQMRVLQHPGVHGRIGHRAAIRSPLDAD